MNLSTEETALKSRLEAKALPGAPDRKPPGTDLLLPLQREAWSWHRFSGSSTGTEQLTFRGFSGVGASSTDASISLAGIHVS